MNIDALLHKIELFTAVPALKSAVIYLAFICLTMIGCVIINVAINKIYSLKQQENFLIRNLLPALKKPLIVYIMIESAVKGVIFIHRYYDFFWLNISNRTLDKFDDLNTTICIAWFMVLSVSRIERDIISQKAKKGLTVNYTNINSISLFIKITVTLIATLQVMSNLGFKLETILTFGGFGSVIIGFAGKDMIANFFGVIMIYLDRPFTIGNDITIPSMGVKGTVENITWRLTVIRQFNKVPIYLPNSVFNTSSFENLSRMTHRRIDEIIRFNYTNPSNITNIVNDIQKIVYDYAEIDNTQNTLAYIRALGKKIAEIHIYCFTHTTSFQKYTYVKGSLLTKIHNMLHTKYSTSMSFNAAEITVRDYDTDISTILDKQDRDDRQSIINAVNNDNDMDDTTA